MLSKNAERIQNALAHIGKTCGYAHKIFRIFFVAYLVVVVLFVCVGIAGVVASGASSSDVAWLSLQGLPVLFSVIVGVLIFRMLIYIFGDISRGNSPFTLQQSKRLQMVGWLLLVSVVVGAIASVIPMPAVHIGSLTLGFTASNVSGISVNVAALFGAIIAFCFSYVFKYGALLQQLSDDTV